MYSEYCHQTLPKNIKDFLTQNNLSNINCSRCSKALSFFKINKYIKKELSLPFICKSCYMHSEEFSKLQKQRMQDKYKNQEYKKSILDKRKLTNQNRYGVDWSQQDKNIIEKQKQSREISNINKYGVSNVMFVPEIKQKTYINMRKSIKNKYNVNNIMQVQDIKNKAIRNQIKTNYERYGVKNKMQIPEFAKEHGQKILKLKQERGTIHAKRRNSAFKFFWQLKNKEEWKYCTPKFMANEVIREKIMITLQNKYGTKDINQIKSKQIFLKKIDELQLNTEYELLFSKNDFVYKGEYLIKCKKCENSFLTDLKFDGNKQTYIWCPYCYIKQPFENDFLLRLRKIYNGEIQRHKRIGEKGKEMYEMDFYIPEFNLGIELNGLYWHCEDNKNKNYHKNKQEFFSKNNIEVIHFWEDEVKNKIDIIIDIIKRKLLLIENKIYARETVFKEITTSEYKEFLIENHLQGYGQAKYKYGLFFNSLLVCVISFGKPRNFMNQFEFELVRYAIKKDYIVIGGFKKMLENALKMIPESKIISFCDPLKFTGKIYENNGFILEKWSSPGFYWTDLSSRFYRFKYPGNSGYQHKLKKIYDAGMKKYSYSKTV